MSTKAYLSKLKPRRPYGSRTKPPGSGNAPAGRIPAQDTRERRATGGPGYRSSRQPKRPTIAFLRLRLPAPRAESLKEGTPVSASLGSLHFLESRSRCGVRPMPSLADIASDQERPIRSASAQPCEDRYRAQFLGQRRSSGHSRSTSMAGVAKRPENHQQHRRRGPACEVDIFPGCSHRDERPTTNLERLVERRGWDGHRETNRCRCPRDGKYKDTTLQLTATILPLTAW